MHHATIGLAAIVRISSETIAFIEGKVGKFLSTQVVALLSIHDVDHPNEGRTVELLLDNHGLCHDRETGRLSHEEVRRVEASWPHSRCLSLRCEFS